MNFLLGTESIEIWQVGVDQEVCSAQGGVAFADYGLKLCDDVFQEFNTEESRSGEF